MHLCEILLILQRIFLLWVMDIVPSHQRERHPLPALLQVMKAERNLTRALGWWKMPLWTRKVSSWLRNEWCQRKWMLCHFPLKYFIQYCMGRVKQVCIVWCFFPIILTSQVYLPFNLKYLFSKVSFLWIWFMIIWFCNRIAC